MSENSETTQKTQMEEPSKTTEDVIPTEVKTETESSESDQKTQATETDKVEIVDNSTVDNSTAISELRNEIKELKEILKREKIDGRKGSKVGAQKAGPNYGPVGEYIKKRYSLK